MAQSRSARPSMRTLREPFERLVDSGLRLSELRSEPELHDVLIDKVTELSGAQRVLLRFCRDSAIRPSRDQKSIVFRRPANRTCWLPTRPAL